MRFVLIKEYNIGGLSSPYEPISFAPGVMIEDTKHYSLNDLTFVQGIGLRESHNACNYSLVRFSFDPDMALYALKTFGCDQTHSLVRHDYFSETTSLRRFPANSKQKQQQPQQQRKKGNQSKNKQTNLYLGCL